MWLLDKMLRRLIKTGELIVLDHDGSEYRYGAPTAGRAPVRARLTDKGAAFHIAKDPRVGAGEAYMDGRMVIEEGDIRDLVLLIRGRRKARSTRRVRSASCSGTLPDGSTRSTGRPARAATPSIPTT
jgi:cyclopropane-fatty-acyl-phospholipid synthase